MNSLDTNILLYATNASCREFNKANKLVGQALSDPEKWIISDQVYFEYYRLLRSPLILERPLKAKEAAFQVEFFRSQSGWFHCSYEVQFFDDMKAFLSKPQFASKRVFDLVLAATLKRNGIKTFYTRNKKDFVDFNWFDVIDPIGN